MNLEEYNVMFQNDSSNVKPMKGFEIICGSMVNQVRDLFGRNALLSILFQIGAGPGDDIAKKIKKSYKREDFSVLEAVAILLNDLRDYYSISVKKIEEDDDKIRLLIENHCFLRKPIKHRKDMKFGSAICRVNKGYFESAFKSLLGNKIKKTEIKFLFNDEVKNACIEEINFYKNNVIQPESSSIL